MKILFTTDLHGNTWKYGRLQLAAREHQVDLVINGGDLLPKTEPILEKQKQFLQTTLDQHFAYFQAAKIPYLVFMGNDDLKIIDGIFESVIQKYPLLHNVAQRKVEIGEHEFIGMNWVLDYPFLLKDRCRLDYPGDAIVPLEGTAVFSGADGFREEPEWEQVANRLPTLKQELEQLPKPDQPKQAVYIVHSPPTGIGLDECESGDQAGSLSVYRFLSEHQPLLSLHGHIHESPEVSGLWHNTIGNTLCIQPGQLQPFTYVLIDTRSLAAERIRIESAQKAGSCTNDLLNGKSEPTSGTNYTMSN